MSEENFSLDIIKAIDSDIRLNILIYLLVFSNKTLDEIAVLFNKSKSTIHHHMQILLESGLVEIVKKKGSKIVYYSAKIDILEDTLIKTGEQAEAPIDSQLMISVLTKAFVFIKGVVDKAIAYNSSIDLEVEFGDVITINQLFSKFPMSAGIRVFTKDQYRKYLARIHQLDREFDEQNIDIKSEVKPYAFFSIGLPIKQLIENEFDK